MNKKILLLSALFTGMYSMAQDSTLLDPVVFTATKYPVKLSQTGKVVNVISSQQIDRSQGKNLAQIITEQSGIVVNGANSNPGKDKSVFLRGASNKYTLILLDGVPVNDPSGPGGAFDLRLFPVENIERVEILKGSQSTLYGSDAVAGVINIITKKGGKKVIGFNGGANWGSYNTLNTDAGINGSTKIIDYNLIYSRSATDGISEANDKDKEGNFDKDGFLRNSIQANFTVKAGKKLTISPYYRYSYYNGDFDADAFTDGANKYHALMNNTGATATLTLPRGTITANYGYTYSKRVYIGFIDSYFKGKFNSGEIYLTQSLNSNLKMLAGINYQDYKLLDTTLVKKNPNTSIISPYVSFFLQSPEGINVEVGSRYNHHSEFGTNFTYSFNTSYLINQQVKAFANVSTGFKAPSASDLFGAWGSNPDLKPEKSENIEAGVQVNALHKKLQVTATGYFRKINDLIVYLDSRLINIDEQKDKGAELEVAYLPNSRWNIKAAYNYVTGQLTQTRAGKDTSFYNLVRRPKNAVTASVGYQATSQLYVSLALQSLGNRTDLFFDPNPPYGTQQVILKNYTLLNFYAEYKLLNEKLRLFVDARNLTDEQFMEVYGYNATGINASAGFRINL